MEQKNEQAQRLNSINAIEKKTNDSVIRMKANLEHIQEELKKVSQQTISLYGSDDVAFLRERFATDNNENETGLKTYAEAVTLRAQLVETVEANVAALRVS